MEQSVARPEYPQDPGGRFKSDYHRRTLGHLTTPEDDYGWTAPALLERMRPDVGTNHNSIDEIEAVLKELESDGYAVCHPGDIWQMTQDGFEVLTGSIANEPPPGAAVLGPATINAPGMAAASRIGGDSDKPAGWRPENEVQSEEGEQTAAPEETELEVQQ